MQFGETRSCHSCSNFSGEEAAERGECRRLPPVLIVVGEKIGCQWPVVKKDAWCGEWRSRAALMR